MVELTAQPRIGADELAARFEAGNGFEQMPDSAARWRQIAGLLGTTHQSARARYGEPV